MAWPPDVRPRIKIPFICYICYIKVVIVKWREKKDWFFDNRSCSLLDAFTYFWRSRWDRVWPVILRVCMVIYHKYRGHFWSFSILKEKRQCIRTFIDDSWQRSGNECHTTSLWNMQEILWSPGALCGDSLLRIYSNDRLFSLENN